MDDFCSKNGFIGWRYTSAKDNINLSESVMMLVRAMTKELNVDVPAIAGIASGTVELIDSQAETKKSTCCG